MKIFGRLPENVGSNTLAVVNMTTANGMHPTFSERHPRLFFIISDLFRSLRTSHGVCRSSLDPSYIKSQKETNKDKIQT